MGWEVRPGRRRKGAVLQGVGVGGSCKAARAQCVPEVQVRLEEWNVPSCPPRAETAVE